jgi:hypothetical protein
MRLIQKPKKKREENLSAACLNKRQTGGTFTFS